MYRPGMAKFPKVRERHIAVFGEIDRSTVLSVDSFVCSSIIDAISIAVLPTVESNQ